MTGAGHDAFKVVLTFAAEFEARHGPEPTGTARQRQERPHRERAHDEKETLLGHVLHGRARLSIFTAPRTRITLRSWQTAVFRQMLLLCVHRVEVETAKVSLAMMVLMDYVKRASLPIDLKCRMMMPAGATSISIWEGDKAQLQEWMDLNLALVEPGLVTTVHEAQVCMAPLLAWTMHACMPTATFHTATAFAGRLLLRHLCHPGLGKGG